MTAFPNDCPHSNRPLGAAFSLAVATVAWAALALATQPRATAQGPVELEGLIVTASRWAEPEWTVATHATVIRARSWSGPGSTTWARRCGASRA